MKFRIKRPDGNLAAFFSGKPILFDTREAAAPWLLAGEEVCPLEDAEDTPSAVIESGRPEVRPAPEYDVIKRLRRYGP